LLSIFKHPRFRIKSAKKFFVIFATVLFATYTILAISSSTDQSATAEYHSTTRSAGVQVVETWIEEWSPEKRCWIRVDQPSVGCSSQVRRLPTDDPVAPSARFGPFVVSNDRVAALVGMTDSESIKQFVRMMIVYPDIDQLNFIDAPGTIDDVSNLKLGRMIRASGISTHVPSNGSARSGAVDLFMAGVRRTMDKGARFAVHCWSDSQGRGPYDFPENDPVNELYLNYYMDMGMSQNRSHQFYAMTNSVPNTAALWFGPEQMQMWIDTPTKFDPEEERQRLGAGDSGREERGQRSIQCSASHTDIFMGQTG